MRIIDYLEMRKIQRGDLSPVTKIYCGVCGRESESHKNEHRKRGFVCLPCVSWATMTARAVAEMGE